METVQTIYNTKMRMFGGKGDRETVGHWKEWVCQKDTRLARDLAKNRQKFATLSPRYISGDTKYEIFKQIKILYFR